MKNILFKSSYILAATICIASCDSPPTDQGLEISLKEDVVYLAADDLGGGRRAEHHHDFPVSDGSGPALARLGRAAKIGPFSAGRVKAVPPLPPRYLQLTMAMNFDYYKRF